MSTILNLFQDQYPSSPPLWFMRQAGRYLPEYRDVRKICQSFLDLCYTPDLAAKVTLQPLDRFDLDAAILFSDILVVPHALGQHVSFEETKGPLLSSLSLSSYQESLNFEQITQNLKPTYETIELVKEKLPSTTAFIGFAGAPWTLALYMLEGQGSRDFAKAKQQAFEQEDKFTQFLDKLVEAVSSHLIAQVTYGVNVLQLFDTWAGLCPATHFEKWILQPTSKLITLIKKSYPHVPIIGFPKGIGQNLVDYGRFSGVSALSLDAVTPLSWAAKVLPQELVLQGNMDPVMLVSGGYALENTVQVIHEQMNKRPYIFNLGHGILPRTPIKNVEDCIKWVRRLR
ncbi:MAG: uroporphyrinogen decarboxylase [Alphaproteobacteria bacterium]|nr:uroporphyrinogen decarboxylase [Alphaproteobacteria bacterium]